MSGPFGSSQWMYSSGGFYPHELGQSLRFNDDDNAYLSRTPASTSNRKTWTWSGWVKRTNLGNSSIFGSGTNSSTQTSLVFVSDDRLSFITETSNQGYQIVSTAKFRDVSAWYNIVVVHDTTNGTANDRMRLYVNGERITSLDVNNNAALNFEGTVNSASFSMFMSRTRADAIHSNLYFAEVNFIDGQALDPTDFGEFKSGVWVANEYTGSYGTNGFYLPFTNGIGDDESGNSNDWTANNLAATDIVLDSPTNNFATLNPLIGTSNLLEGNLSKNYFVDGSNTTASSTFAIPSSGKWYFEFSKNTSTNYGVYVGITTYVDANDYTGSNYTLYLVNTGGIFKDGSSIATVTADTDTWIVGIAVDADSNNVSFYLNGTLQGTYSYTSVSSDYFAYFAGVSGGSYTNNMLANFGQDSSFAGNKTAQGNTDDNGIGDFYYTPPSGYLALCTSNLPDPVIDPAQDEVPSDYFNTVLYTGNGSTQSITGVGFQPDLVWGKNRSTTGYHQLFDVIRGVTHNLASNSTDAEGTITSLITSFDSDGFSVGNNNDLNQSSTSIVAWNWLAGNGTSSNTDGSITSTVSVNQKAGFSIVSYTGTGSAATVGHGLDSAPEMVIVKNRSVTGRSWAVYNEAIGASNYLALNQTSASASVTTVWNSTAPTSSVFSIGNNTWTGANAEDYIAYCFHSVEGYSKFGSYTGNGSTDGPFVYTGFRPALTIVKRTDASGNSWRMHDDKRGFNGAIDRLHANLSNAEVTGTTDLDVLSNGFKVRTNSTDQNASGGTYIFMAFAENPFKYSNAR